MLFEPLPTPEQDQAELAAFDAACHERMRLMVAVLTLAHVRGYPPLCVMLARAHGPVAYQCPRGEAAWRQDASNWPTDILDAIYRHFGG